LNYPEPIEGLPIVAIDFDGVLAENIWPDPAIGRPIKSGIAMVLHYAEQGNEVLVYTARPESHKPRILKWLEMVGLHNDVYDVICGKIRAGLMIDDRCWNPVQEEFEGGTVSTGQNDPGRDAGSTPAPSTEGIWGTPRYDNDWVERMMGGVNG
jgi:hypothetical protein